jgi:hypothetical protein
MPRQTGETYSYKGWLISDSFFKRAFAVLGYNIVAGLIIYIPLMIVMSFIILPMLMSMAPMMMQPPMGQGMNMDMPPIPPGEMMNPNMMGKIDINEVCNGALAYTTFESGEAADAFVQECVEGKRPEVIEQYMQQMQQVNGTDPATI